MNETQLQHSLDRLGLEANILSNLITLFRQTLPNLVDHIKERVSGFADGLKGNDSPQVVNSFKEVTKRKQSAIEKKIESLNFTTYGKTVVSIPEGFQGNLLVALRTYNEVSDEIYKITMDELGHFAAMLSLFLTNKEHKQTNRDETHYFKKAASAREVFSKKTSVFFPTQSAQSKQYLGRLIERFADVVPCVTETNKLCQTHTFQAIHDIQEAVNKCVDLLDMIIKAMQEGEVSTVSGAAANNIAQASFEMGKLVEFLAIHRFRSEQLIASTTALLETLDNIQ